MVKTIFKINKLFKILPPSLPLSKVKLFSETHIVICCLNKKLQNYNFVQNKNGVSSFKLLINLMVWEKKYCDTFKILKPKSKYHKLFVSYWTCLFSILPFLANFCYYFVNLKIFPWKREKRQNWVPLRGVHQPLGVN